MKEEEKEEKEDRKDKRGVETTQKPALFFLTWQQTFA